MGKSPFGFEQPEDSLGFLLWQTTMCWQREIKKALEEHAISHPQFVIMATLAWFTMHNTAINQTNIINWTKLDKMTVSKSLAKLADEKLVQRQEHPDDTRAKSVCLTPAGETLIKKLVPIVENVDQRFFKKLAKKEQKNLIGAFKGLIKED